MDAATSPERFRGVPVAAVALSAWCLGMVLVVVADGSVVGRLLAAVVVVGVATTVHLLGRRRRRAEAVAFVALGIVGVDAGITFGGRYLLADGPSLLSLAGLLCLAGGSALLVIGAARLTEATGRWRVLAIPLLAVSVALVVWNTMPAVLATNVPPIERGDATPAEHGLASVDARFRSADGVELAGWYVPSRNGAAVVLRHGAGSTATANLEQAAVIAAHGYGVLITDARGHGLSDGRAMDFGWYGDEDVIGAVSYLTERPEVDPDRIGVVGFSMGGEEAIGAMAADSRIRTVVAEGATGRSNADQRWFDDVYGWRGSIQLALEWVEFTLTDLLTDASKPPPLAGAAAASAPRRILLVTAGKVADEQHAAEHIRAAAPDRVVIHRIDGADHTGGLEADRDSWETTVIGWLDSELAPAGTGGEARLTPGSG